MNDYQQPESSEAIKADIEQTRAGMGAKIDQLQHKLDPSRLKEQAQETVRDFVSESRTAMMDYVRENRQELTSGVMHAIKQNPVPTALIGLGIGWLIVESMTPAKQDRSSYERNRYLPVRREDAPNFQSRYNTGDRSGQNWSDYGRTPTYGEWQGSSGVTAQGPRVGQGYQGSQSYLGSQAYQSGQVGQNYTGYQGQGYQGQSGQSNWSQGSSQQYSSGEQYRASQQSTSGARREDEEHTWTEEVKQRAQDAAHTVSEKAGDAVESVRDAASSVGERVSELGQRVGDRFSSMGEQVSDMGERLGDRVGDMRYQARDRAGQFGQQMGQRSDSMGMQARQMGRQLESRMEENPLLMGALAFAAGAAVAMLLPQSRVENRMVGPARDQVMGQVKETAQELVDDVAQRAERVVEEVRPDLEQAARKVVEDVKQTGKEAAQELQGAAQKAQETAKQEVKAEGEQIKGKVQNVTGKSSQQASSSSSSGSSSSSSAMSNMPGSGPQSSSQSSGSLGSQSGSVVSATPATGQGKATGIPANWDVVKGQWHQWRGEAKRQWGKLTDDDLTRVEGDYEKLVGLIQKQYGYSRSQAEQEINSFSRTKLSSRS